MSACSAYFCFDVVAEYSEGAAQVAQAILPLLTPLAEGFCVYYFYALKLDYRIRSVTITSAPYVSLAP